MRKDAFLTQLRAQLSGLSPIELEERLAFYSEAIDDRIEDGLSEEEAVAAVGTVEAVANQILSETPISKLVKQKIRPKKRLHTWEVVLLAVGSPLWLSLLIAVIAIVFSVYVSFWSVAIALWATALAVAVVSPCMVASAIPMLVQGDVSSGIAFVGGGLIVAGVSILLVLGCIAVTKGMFLLSKSIALGIKWALVGRGDRYE